MNVDNLMHVTAMDETQIQNCDGKEFVKLAELRRIKIKILLFKDEE